MAARTLHIALLSLFCAFMWLLSAGTVAAQQSNAKVLEDIKSAYENLDIQAAEARIKAALEAFERFSPIELAEIHKISALIHFVNSDLEGTRRELELALQTNPNLQLDPRETPPPVAELFDDILRQAGSPPSQTEIRYLVVQDPRPAAVMRSMILPGWGQLYKEEKTKGILFMSAWGVTSVGSVVAHIKRQQAEDHYLAAANLAEIEDRYPAFDNWHRARNNLFIAAAGIWAISYVDALLNQNTPALLDENQRTSFSVLPAPGAPRFTLKYTF